MMLARNEWIGGALAGYEADDARAFKNGFGRVLRLWRKRIRDREELAAMSERDLRDARLSRADVAMEIRKPFWRA
jgi:uncharacterized protein YjiS (DUF1127 family)